MKLRVLRGMYLRSTDHERGHGFFGLGYMTNSFIVGYRKIAMGQ